MSDNVCRAKRWSALGPVLAAAVAVGWGLAVLPLGASAADAKNGQAKEPSDVGSKSANEKEFERIYKQYAARFYEKMTTEAEGMKPVQVMMEAARIWDDTWAGHEEVLVKRSEEILRGLDTAAPIKEELYNEVASGARVEPAPDQPQGVVLKQFLWSPIGAAQMGLNNWLARLLQQESFAMRSVMSANASLFWEAIDRNVDHPKLAMRQGPMIFIVDLTRKGDYYQVEKVRWLRPKAMGPITPAKESGKGTPPGGTPLEAIR